jgi:hypothetical protein
LKLQNGIFEFFQKRATCSSSYICGFRGLHGLQFIYEQVWHRHSKKNSEQHWGMKKTLLQCKTSCSLLSIHFTTLSDHFNPWLVLNKMQCLCTSGHRKLHMVHWVIIWSRQDFSSRLVLLVCLTGFHIGLSLRLSRSCSRAFERWRWPASGRPA